MESIQIVTGPFKVMLTLKHDQEVVEEKSGETDKKKDGVTPPEKPAETNGAQTKPGGKS